MTNQPTSQPVKPTDRPTLTALPLGTHNFMPNVLIVPNSDLLHFSLTLFILSLGHIFFETAIRYTFSCGS
jgi:hypothetical protein